MSVYNWYVEIWFRETWRFSSTLSTTFTSPVCAVISLIAHYLVAYTDKVPTMVWRISISMCKYACSDMSNACVLSAISSNDTKVPTIQWRTCLDIYVQFNMQVHVCCGANDVAPLYRLSNAVSLLSIFIPALKRIGRHFDKIFVTGCTETESCHFDNFQCSQWRKFQKLTFLL